MCLKILKDNPFKIRNFSQDTVFVEYAHFCWAQCFKRESKKHRNHDFIKSSLYLYREKWDHTVLKGWLAEGIWYGFVLTMIYHFGRTTGHQAYNPSLHFLLLSDYSNIKRRNSSFTLTPARCCPGRVGTQSSCVKAKVEQKDLH